MSTSKSTGEATAGAQAPDSLTMVEVLTMTVDELRSELQNRGLAPHGNTKPDLQAALLTAIREPPAIRITAEAEQDKVFLDPGSNPDILQIQLKKWKWRKRG